MKEKEGDNAKYYKACRMALLAFCCFPNSQWSSAEDMLAPDVICDGQAEQLLVAFVCKDGPIDLGDEAGPVPTPAGAQTEAPTAASGPLELATVEAWCEEVSDCPHFLRELWTEQKKKELRKEKRAQRAATQPPRFPHAPNLTPFHSEAAAGEDATGGARRRVRHRSSWTCVEGPRRLGSGEAH